MILVAIVLGIALNDRPFLVRTGSSRANLDLLLLSFVTIFPLCSLDMYITLAAKGPMRPSIGELKRQSFDHRSLHEKLYQRLVSL
eukprot:5138824-Amphidinium_carterae.1